MSARAIRRIVQELRKHCDEDKVRVDHVDLACRRLEEQADMIEQGIWDD